MNCIYPTSIGGTAISGQNAAPFFLVSPYNDTVCAAPPVGRQAVILPVGTKALCPMASLTADTCTLFVPPANLGSVPAGVAPTVGAAGTPECILPRTIGATPISGQGAQPFYLVSPTNHTVCAVPPVAKGAIIPPVGTPTGPQCPVLSLSPLACTSFVAPSAL
jgi:hypothetical protein